MEGKLSMKKILVVVFAITFIFNIFISCAAAEESSVPGKMARKFGRGLCNVALGWCEIPKNIMNSCEEINPYAGWFVGLIKGIGMTLARTLAGVWDIVTFPIPAPSDYEPVMEPEFVFESLSYIE